MSNCVIYGCQGCDNCAWSDPTYSNYMGKKDYKQSRPISREDIFEQLDTLHSSIEKLIEERARLLEILWRNYDN